MDFQNSWWNISTSSLVILAASHFEISCGKKQTKTDRQTDTNTIKNRTPATTVGVGKNVYAKLSRKIIEDIQLK